MSIVFYQDADRWVAHCLEFDLIGDGETQGEALQCLSDSVLSQLAWSLDQNDQSLLFNPAPSEYFQMFAEGEDICGGELEVAVTPIEPPEDMIFEAPRLRQYSQRGGSARNRSECLV